jgi:uncharacterized protein (DUF1330 family)
MINVLVTLEVIDFDLLATFETKAVNIMHSHGGRLISAFETVRNENGSGQEVHVLEFPNEDTFIEYRRDSRLLEQAELRNKAIASAKVIISSALKNYC